VRSFDPIATSRKAESIAKLYKMQSTTDSLDVDGPELI